MERRTYFLGEDLSGSAYLVTTVIRLLSLQVVVSIPEAGLL